MKHIILLLLLCPFLLTSCVTSQRISFLTYDTAKSDSININEYEVKYKDYPGVILSTERTIEHTGTGQNIMQWPAASGWEFHSIRKNKFLVLNPDKQEFTTFEFTVGKYAKINKFYLKMTSIDRTVKLFNLKDCKTETNSIGDITYKFVYPDVKKGNIIEEGIDFTYAAGPTYVPLQHDIDFQSLVPCEKYIFKYAFPDWWTIKIKKISADDTFNYNFTEDKDHNKKVLVYEANNIPPYSEESWSPYRKEISRYLEFMVTSFMMNNFKSTSASSWNYLGTYFKDHEMNRTGFLSSKVSDLTEDLIKDCKTEFEKLDKITTWIQQNIETDNYASDRNFASIISTKKGTSYGVVGLAQSMLSKAGLKTDYILIHSAEQGYFDWNYFNEQQVSIPGIRTIADNVEYISLPQYKYLPVSYVPDDLQGQAALRISNDSNAEIFYLNNKDIIKNLLTENIELNISNDGNIKVTEEKKFTGMFAFYLREKLSKLSDDKKDKFIKELIDYKFSDMTFGKCEIINSDNPRESLNIKLEYSINNLVTVTPEEIIFQASGLFIPFFPEGSEIDSTNRKNPIKIPYNVTSIKNINVNYPSVWKVQTPLKDIDFNNIFGNTTSKYQSGDGHINVTLELNLTKTNQPKEMAGELLKLIKSSPKISVPAIVFKSNQAVN